MLPKNAFLALSFVSTLFSGCASRQQQPTTAQPAKTYQIDVPGEDGPVVFTCPKGKPTAKMQDSRSADISCSDGSPPVLKDLGGVNPKNVVAK